MNQLIDRHRRKIAACFVYFVLLVFSAYFLRHLWSLQTAVLSSGIVFVIGIGAVAVALALITVLLLLSRQGEKNFGRMAVLSVAVLALGYMVFFTPVTVPDEQAHYLSAYRMSNYFLLHFSQRNTDGIWMRVADAEFFGQFYNSATVQLSRYLDLKHCFSLFAQDKTLILYDASTATNAPFGYIAPALGMAVGRLLQLGAVPVFYLGRLFNIGQYVLALHIAMKRAPMAKTAFYAFSVFPITLHLIASVSYDPGILCFAMLFTAEIIRMYYGETITLKQLIWCTVLAALLAPSKMVYTPLLLLILLIPSEKLRQIPCKKLQKLLQHPVWLKLAMIAIAVLVLLVIQIGNLSVVADDTSNGNIVSWAEEEGYNVGWVLHHPLGTAVVFFNTIWCKLDFYLTSLMGSSLGWFQVSVPMFLYLPFGVMFLIGCIRKDGEPAPLPGGAKLWVLLLALGSSALILASMLLCWTPLSYDYIEGVQGRYFLPLLPAVYLLVRGNALQVKGSINGNIVILATTLQLLILMNCCVTML